MILVDSCVWSIALRRRMRDRNPDEQKAFFAWRDLIIAGQACLIGPVRQEVLSGLTTPAAYEALRAQLDPQPDLPLSTNIWNLAADFFNQCRWAGIAPDAIDMTICAAAHLHSTPIFTTDPDFTRYARHLPIALHRY